MPAVNGRFPQISGLCFAYEITGGAGGRVNVASAVRTDLAGNCTGPPVTFGALDSYTIAINDFIAGGGDSYPVVTGKPSYATRDLMDEVLADYITASTPVAPFVKAPPPAVNGRINCTDANGVLAPNCPTLAPSFPWMHDAGSPLHGGLPASVQRFPVHVWSATARSATAWVSTCVRHSWPPTRALIRW